MKVLKLLNWKSALLVIVFIAAFLRFYQLDKVPPGIHADEADTGYAAYSILKTGKTQFGDFNLLALHEHNGGTHPPMYTYILIPLVSIFGLNITVERMPSVISGIGLVIVFYFLLKKLSDNRKIALIGTFLLAINPWAIQMSRQGLLEALALFFVVLGITLFLYAKNTFTYSLAAFFLGLSLHSYDAPKIVIPFIFLALVIYKRKSFKKNIKPLAIATTILILLYALMVYVLLIGQIKDYEAVSIFRIDTISKTVDSERHLTYAPLAISSIFHNKLSVSASLFTTNYLQIFTPNWFFKNGQGNLAESVTNHGEYYLYELPLFILGVFLIFNKNKRLGTFLLIWMLAAPIPGAITLSGNFPLRSVMLLPVPIIFSSFGLAFVLDYFKEKKLLNIFSKVIISIIIFYFTASYLFTFFFDYPVYASEVWAKQQNEAIVFALSQSNEYKNVFFEGGVDWAMMYGFLKKEDPKVFQKAYTHPVSYKGIKFMEIDNFYLANGSDLSNITMKFFPSNSLIITTGGKYKKLKSIKKFYDPGGVRVIFEAYSTK